MDLPIEEAKVEEPPKPLEEAKPEIVQPVIAKQEEKKEEIKVEEPKVEVKEKERSPTSDEDVQAKVNIPGFK